MTDTKHPDGALVLCEDTEYYEWTGSGGGIYTCPHCRADDKNDGATCDKKVATCASCGKQYAFWYVEIIKTRSGFIDDDDEVITPHTASRAPQPEAR